MSQLNPLRCEKNDLINLVNTISVKNGWGEVLNSKILKELENNGLHTERVGSKKYYSIFELAVFLVTSYTAKSSDTLETLIEDSKVKIIDEVMVRACSHKEK